MQRLRVRANRRGQLVAALRPVFQYVGEAELCRHIDRLGDAVPVEQMAQRHGWGYRVRGFGTLLWRHMHTFFKSGGLLGGMMPHSLPAWAPPQPDSRAERQGSAAAGSGSEARADAGGSQLQGVVRGLGGCAASHVEGTGSARALRALLVGSPWVVVTVPALVLCARL